MSILVLTEHKRLVVFPFRKNTLIPLGGLDAISGSVAQPGIKNALNR